MPRTLALALLLGAASQAALAQSGFPSKPVRAVVPYAAGGPSDTVTRTVAQRMAQFLGGPVVVENRAGANGLIGMEHVAKSPGDGYTMVMFSLGGSVLNTVLREKMPYDLLKDFRPVGNMVIMSPLMVVNPALPVRSVRELVAYAKANPNKLSYGSSGVAGTPHLMGEMLKQSAGIQLTHVPYKGTGPATVDVMSGQIHMIITEMPVLIQHVNAGKLRPLAVTGPQRSGLLPEVPTIAEAGFPEITAYNWFGLAAPAATPRELLLRLNDALQKTLAQPETAALLRSQGAEPAPGTPEQYGQLIEREIARWTKVVKESGVKAE